MSNSQLDLGLDLDYDSKTKEQLANQRLELYKLKLAKKYKLIVFTSFNLLLTNVLILFLFIYSNFILKLHYQNTGEPIDIHFETTGQPIAIYFK